MNELLKYKQFLKSTLMIYIFIAALFLVAIWWSFFRGEYVIMFLVSVMSIIWGKVIDLSKAHDKAVAELQNALSNAAMYKQAFERRNRRERG